jgi:broad specificity phosphatase PhoE
MPFNIQDPYWSKVHPGMPCRIKHRIILVRHGESESNIELMTSGQTSEYQIDYGLTALGMEQAQDVANFFESKGLKTIGIVIADRVQISPLWRTIQTAAPTLKKEPYCADAVMTDVTINYELREKYSKKAYLVSMPNIYYYGKLTLRPNYKQKNFDKEHNCDIEWEHYWVRKPETDTDFCKRVKGVVEEWKKEGTVEERKQTIVFTHSQFISQVLAGDSKMSFHLANGSISIIDIDEENNLHVQVANYTKHLRTPTGMHTCIF